MLRNQRKISALGIVPGVRLDTNPFAQSVGSARILRNFIPERGRLARKSFSPNFTVTPSVASGRVWHVVNFRYTRSSAQENKVLIFRADGKVYQRQSSYEQEIFPGTTSFSVLAQRPFVGQLSNRLFFHDGVSGYVYDGRNVQAWGIARTSPAATVTAQNLAGSIVAATGVKAAVTWVVLDEADNRVHESSRTNKNASFVVVTGTDDSARIDITALSPPARATHWSGYLSELNGSEVLRRVNTTRITTLTYDATAFPAATSPVAPIRNDFPPSAIAGTVAKNRIFIVDESDRSKFWFSALGEVKGLLNGAPDESFCGKDSSSISDIVNSDFVVGEIRAIVQHSNIIFLFTESRTYALIGEMSLLDNFVSRSLVKLEQFAEGCVGAYAAISSPFGLIFMSPGRKLWLSVSGNELRDIGEPIQKLLDSIPADELKNVYMKWWGGHGRQWLTIALNSGDGEDTANNRNRLLIYDFSIPSQRPDSDPDPGSWYEFVDVAATCVGTYTADDGQEFLLVGDTSGNVKLVDVICSPTHLNRSFVLGQTYLGSTVQNNPQATLRTSLILPQGDVLTVGEYLALITGDQSTPGTPALGSLTQPTVTSWIDIENVDSPGTGSTLTLDTAIPSADRRAWLIPETSGNTNVGGALAKQYLFQAEYAAGVDSDGQADGRLTARVNTIYKMAFNWSPASESAQ